MMTEVARGIVVLFESAICIVSVDKLGELEVSKSLLGLYKTTL